MTLFAGADVDQVEVGLPALGVRGVGDHLAVHPPDAHRTDGARERDVGDGERGRGAVDAQDVGVVLAVAR